MSMMRIGSQMQVVAGYMACGTVIFDMYFLDAAQCGPQRQIIGDWLAVTAGM
jgi:hypothetical protein